MKHKKNYVCHALIEGNKRCGKPSWGRTAYCRWHNACLYWHIKKMMWRSHSRKTSHRRVGIPLRAYFDPKYAESWTTSPLASNKSVLFLFIELIFALFIGFLIGIGKTQFSVTFILRIACWIAIGICIWAMYNGNKSLFVPKVLVGVIVALTSMQIIEWMAKDHVITWISILTDFGYLVGFFLLAVPILTGPLIQSHADPTNSEIVPPLNQGDRFVKRIGTVLVIVSLLLLYFGWRENKLKSVLKESQKTTTIAQESNATQPKKFPPSGQINENVVDPPSRDGLYKFFEFVLKKKLILIWLLAYFICMHSAVKGSLKSIRSEWHKDEALYSRYIRPSVKTVTGLPAFGSSFISIFIYSGLVWIRETHDWLNFISLIVGAMVSFIWTKRRGTRIYTQNVHRAGY